MGQKLDGDQFGEILAMVAQADTIIVGAPIYWHMISVYAKVFYERLSRDSNGLLPGKKLGMFIHGSEPSDAVEPAQNIVYRFCQVEKLTNLGVKVVQINFFKNWRILMNILHFS